MKQCEVMVNITWEYDKEEGNVKQLFKFENKKYLHNPSYNIHDKFEHKIIEKSFTDDRNIIFKDMVRSDNLIVIYYKSNKYFDYSKLKPVFYKISSTLPDNEGCKFCKYYGHKNSICYFRDNQYIHNQLKTCRFFKQRKLNKT